MPRSNIENLPIPPKRYRPNCSTENPNGIITFETKQDARREDKKRVKALKRQLKRDGHLLSPKKRTKIIQLIKDIKHAKSQASSVYMRKQRIRIAGNLWQIIDEGEAASSCFTLIPRTWEFPGEQLHKADPIILLAQLRQALIRDGADAAGGWLFVGLHGEHEPTEDIYRLHVHGVATGGMIAVVDRLRKRSNFKSERKPPTSDPVYQRLRMTRETLANLPEPLTYMTQSFWPAKTIFELRLGDTRRQTKKHRIKGPRHTEVLMWQSKHRLRDTTLLMGIRATKSGLEIIRKTYTNGGGI